jgi:CHASE2 domain-containing sensor protein
MKHSAPARVPSARQAKDILQRISFLFRDPRFRLRFEVGLAIGLGVGLLVSIALFLGILNPLDNWLTDLVYQPIPPSGHVAMIAIDQKTLDQLGPYPWSPDVYAHLLDRLHESKPRVIALDLVLPGPYPEDANLVSAIHRAGNVILATEGAEEAKPSLRPGSFPQYDELVLPASELGAVAYGIGHRILSTDPDGVLRRVPVAIDTTNSRVPSLGISASQAFLKISRIDYDLPHRRVTLGKTRIRTDEYGRILLNFTGEGEEAYIYSFADVIDGRVPPSAFIDKIVFVGGTALTDLAG